MIGTYLDGRDELYHRAKFGEVRRPTTRAACRCENVMFFAYFCLSRSESGAPCVRGVHSSNKHCVAVYRPISTRFQRFFSEGIALSDALHSSHFISVARWRHNFREIAVNKCESPKIGGKVCANHFV